MMPSRACGIWPSIYIVNDRLRDARRKLGVSSSREVARLLGRTECGTSKLRVPDGLEVSTATVDTAGRPSPGRWHRGDRPLFRLGGGMLVVFAAMPLPGFHADDSHLSPDPVPATAMAAIAVAKVSAMA